MATGWPGEGVTQGCRTGAQRDIGDPDSDVGVTGLRDLPKTWRRRIEVSSTGCWLWQGVMNKNGYGRTVVLGRRVMAHRAVYELLVGAIPEGLQLDHRCRQRHCLNPEHVEPVTNRVNVLRGVGVTAVNARKTECPRGHAYDEANTYKAADGSRHCRTCRKARAAQGASQ